MSVKYFEPRMRELLERAFEAGFNSSSDAFNNSHFKGVEPDKLMGLLAEFERRRQRAVLAMAKDATEVIDYFKLVGGSDAEARLEQELKGELINFANILDRFGFADRSDW